MNKSFIYFILTILFVLMFKEGRTQANNKHSLSVNFGPEMIAPERQFWETHRIGVGGSVKGEYTFGKHSSFTINSGILFFNGKRRPEDFTVTSPEFYENLVAIPVKFGSRYYVGNFYFLGEAGAMILSNYSDKTRLSFSAGIGDKIKIGAHKIDISLRQEIWLGNREQLHMAGLRIAYEIPWK